MGKLAAGQKLRRFLRFLITPAQPMDPTIKIPVRRSLVLVVTVGLVLLELWYFYVVPYDSIPAKSVFWIACVGWGIAPVVLQWRGRDLATKRAVNMQANFFIGFGIAVVILTIVVRRVDSLLPVVEAIMPGAMGGGIVAAIGSLIWQKPKTAA